ncbi:MAG: hypothetical protein C4540_02535 [Candidatus Omnitrophota bacterium]|jgi:hypothetical protein|nr:MAG: hypothetical protein C4540_02535 [Candidatus Omnitrophota bacterium]
MKTRNLIILAITIFLLAACKSQENRATPTTRPTPTEGPLLFKVNKSTGLYTAPHADAGMIVALPVGTKLIPARGEKFQSCKTYEEPGMTIVMCEMEVVETGKIGWVIKKWMTSQH